MPTKIVALERANSAEGDHDGDMEERPRRKKMSRNKTIRLRPRYSIRPPKEHGSLEARIQQAFYDIASVIDSGRYPSRSVVNDFGRIDRWIQQLVVKLQQTRSELRRSRAWLEWYESRPPMGGRRRPMTLRDYNLAQAAIARSGKRDRSVRARCEDLRAAKAILGALPADRQDLLERLEDSLASEDASVGGSEGGGRAEGRGEPDHSVEKDADGS